MVKLEPHHADLLLKIYDLRREEKLRRARAWLLGSFRAENMDQFKQACPIGSDENAYYRQTITYWDMVAVIVNRGMLDQDLFFETTLEAMLVWQRVKAVVQGFREIRKNPLYVRNLELMAEKQAEWLETRAPGALEATLKAVQAPGK